MPEDNEDLVEVFSQIHKIEGKLLTGILPPRAIRGSLQCIIDQQIPMKDRIAVHQPALLTLSQQLNRLQEINREVWGGFLPEEELRQFHPEVEDVLPQRLDRFQLLHVEGESTRQTIEMWCKVLKRDCPDFDWSRWPRILETYGEPHVVRGSRLYEQGVHIVCLDMTAYWRPKNGPDEPTLMTVEMIRELATGSERVNLAQGEVFSALGLHPTLFMRIGELGLGGMPGQVIAGYGFERSRGALVVDGVWSRSSNVSLALCDEYQTMPECAFPILVDLRS